MAGMARITMLLVALLCLFRSEAQVSEARALRGADDDGDTAATAATDGADDQTTTPAQAVSTVSILSTLKKQLDVQLHEGLQWVNGLVGLVFGFVLLVDGQSALGWVVAGAVFFLSYALTMSEISVALPGAGHLIHSVVGCEVGAVMGYATWKGNDGVLLVLGGSLGFIVSQGIQTKLVEFGVKALHDNLMAIVAFYSVITFASVAFFSLKKHQRYIAVLSVFLGGGLFASSASWAMTTIILSNPNNYPGIAPVGGAWIDFLALLVGGSKDVGLFAHSDLGFQFLGGTWSLDRIVGCVAWVLLFVLGYGFQFKVLGKESASAREGGLHKALLEEE